METITANCPECKTQYQLTEEQLAVAQGQVRCGSCMTVFQARDNRLDVSAAEEDEELLFDDSSVIDDELVDIDDELEDFSVAEVDDSFSDSFNDIGAETDSFGSLSDSSDELAPMESGNVNLDESWAEQLLDDDGEFIDEEPEKPSFSGNHTSALGSDADDFDDLGLDEELKLSTAEDNDADLAFADMENPFGNNEKEGLLQRITPEPLEFQMAVRNSGIAKIFYSFIAVIAVIAMFVQYAYFEFDNKARQSTWRPFYAYACMALDCQLPSKYKIDDISAKHLTIKSHPHYQGVLLVDTIITNHANIHQPFPELELYFTDNKQQIVAARRFQPQEYLRGELAAKTMMPSRQPVHLAIEIADPGKAASGYWMKPVYSESSQ